MNEKIENEFFKPSELKAITLYLIVNSLLGSVVLIFIASIITLFNKDYSFIQLFELAAISVEDIGNLSSDQQYMYYNLNTYTNLICYLLGFIVVCLFMRNHLLDDFNELKKRPIYFGVFMLIGAILFYIISILVSYGIDQLVGVSNNQSLIEGMILNGGAVAIFFAVVVFAPMVEELIYRKAIFKLLEKKHISIAYVVSTIVFVLPHMLSTPITNIGDWLLLCVPYFISAILLCMSYHLSNKNIYVSWFIHMINNLVTFILILL